MTSRRTLALGLTVCLLVLLLRVLFGSWIECRRASAEMEAARPYQAVLHYERAIRWYLPGNPYVGRAAEKLWQLGEASRDAGDPELALFAFRGLRASAYATRSFYQPLPRRIEAAEAQIAELMVADTTAAWPDKELAPEERHRIVLENLQRNDDPSTPWVIVLELGFMAWLVGGFVLAWRLGLRQKKARTTWILVGSSVSGYLLWILGMWKA